MCKNIFKRGENNLRSKGYYLNKKRKKTIDCYETINNKMNHFIKNSTEIHIQFIKHQKYY